MISCTDAHGYDHKLINRSRLVFPDIRSQNQHYVSSVYLMDFLTDEHFLTDSVNGIEGNKLESTGICNRHQLNASSTELKLGVHSIQQQLFSIFTNKCDKSQADYRSF